MFWLSTGTRFSLPVGITTVRFVADDLAQLGIGVAVAVGIAQDDEATELLRGAHLLDHAVVDGDDRCVLRRRRC